VIGVDGPDILACQEYSEWKNVVTFRTKWDYLQFQGKSTIYDVQEHFPVPFPPRPNLHVWGRGMISKYH
jgi:hypothetical protein